MADQRIIRTSLKFLLQFQQGFCCFEKHFNIPAHAINPNDLLVAQCAIGTQNGKPIALLVSIVNEYDFHSNAIGLCRMNGTKNPFLSIGWNGQTVELVQGYTFTVYKVALF